MKILIKLLNQLQLITMHIMFETMIEVKRKFSQIILLIILIVVYQDIYSLSRMSVSKRIGQNSKIKFSDLSNDDNNCVPKVIKKYTESTDNKDSISKNNHQSTQLFSTEKIIIDKNFKYKAFDKDSMNAKKRYKTVNESAQIGNNLKKSNTKQSKIKSVDNNDLKLCLNNNNAQTSTKNSDEIETIQNYPDFNKNIAGNKLSILSRDMSGKMIKLNNDSNDFGVKNDVTENSEPSNKKKMSAIEGLKLFGGESVLEVRKLFLVLI